MAVLVANYDMGPFSVKNIDNLENKIIIVFFFLDTLRIGFSFFGCNMITLFFKSGAPSSSVNVSDVPYLSLSSLTLRILQDFGTR